MPHPTFTSVPAKTPDLLAVTRDGSKIASARRLDTSVTLVDLARPGEPKEVQFEHGVAGLAFLEDDLVVALIAREPTPQFRVALVEPSGRVRSCTQPREITLAGAACAVSPDGTRIAVTCPGEQTYLWTAEALREGQSGDLVSVGGGGSAAPLAFDEANRLRMPIGGPIEDDERTRIVSIAADGTESSVPTTLQHMTHAISASGDRVCVIGGRWYGTCAVLDAEGKVLLKLEQTFQAAALSGELVIGATSGIASLKKLTGWRAPAVADAKKGFVGVAELGGAMRKVVALDLKPGDAVRCLTVVPGKLAAIGLSETVRAYPWEGLVQ